MLCCSVLYVGWLVGWFRLLRSTRVEVKVRFIFFIGKGKGRNIVKEYPISSQDERELCGIILWQSWREMMRTNEPNERYRYRIEWSPSKLYRKNIIINFIQPSFKLSSEFEDGNDFILSFHITYTICMIKVDGVVVISSLFRPTFGMQIYSNTHKNVCWFVIFSKEIHMWNFYNCLWSEFGSSLLWIYFCIFIPKEGIWLYRDGIIICVLLKNIFVCMVELLNKS